MYFDKLRSLQVSRVQRSEQKRVLGSNEKTAGRILLKFYGEFFGCGSKIAQRLQGSHEYYERYVSSKIKKIHIWRNIYVNISIFEQHSLSQPETFTIKISRKSSLPFFH